MSEQLLDSERLVLNVIQEYINENKVFNINKIVPKITTVYKALKP